MSSDLHFLIAENSQNPIFVFDKETKRFIYTNEAFLQAFQLKQESFSLDQLISRLLPEDKPFLKKSYEEFLKELKKGDVEVRMKGEGDEVVWFRLMANLIHSGDVPLISGTLIDITLEKRNFGTSIKYADKKNSILNILAHDLIGPLGIANILAEQMKGRVDLSLLKHTETIIKMCKHCIDMVRDLTEREFLETAEVILVKKRVNVVKKLRDYIAEYIKAEASANRNFNFKTSDDKIFLEIDESKFIQVINNLVTNSLKFTREGAQISLEIIDKSETVLFVFSDDGIGIPENLQPELFEKFTRARRKGLNGEPTTGLGMSIAKTIVEWHQGKIWFESAEGEGTTFFIELPKVSLN